MKATQFSLALGALAVTLMAAGCTTQLNAVRMDTAADSEVPAAGAPYSLPFTQFTVTLTRRLVSCEESAGVPKATIAATAEIVSAEVPDPARQYVIDLESIQGLGKKTNLVIEYHANGALKSINADAADQSAAIVGNLTKVAGTLVRNIAGGAGAAQLPPACSDKSPEDGGPSALRLVTDLIPASEKKVKEATRKVALTTAEMERETRLAATLGKDWSAADRRRMAALVRRLHDENQQHLLATTELKGHLAKVTIETKAVWPTDGAIPHDGVLDAEVFPALDDKILERWLAVEDDEFDRVRRGTAVGLRIASDLPGSSLRRCKSACPGDAIPGIKYRIPQPARLEVYRMQEGERKEVGRHVGLVSQLGPVYALPLKSVPFSDRKLVATFTDAGLPIKLGFESNAAAEVATASIAGLLTEAASVRGDVVTSELERVQERTALLVAQRQLEVAEAALQPNPNAASTEATSQFQVDTALANAELAYLQAVRALEAARQQAATGNGQGQ